MSNFELYEVDEWERKERESASIAGRKPTTTAKSAPDAGSGSRSRRISLKLNRGERVALRLMESGSQGCVTSELFAGLFVAKYTNATSEMRRVGHQYVCEPVGKFPGEIETSQWRYKYAGFTGDRETLKAELRVALGIWEIHNPATVYSPTQGAV